MKTRNFKIAISIGLLGILGCCVAQTVQTPQQEINIKMEISTPRKLYFQMEPIFCEIQTTNVGKETIPFFESWLERRHPYEFVVKNREGKQLPPTAYYLSVQETAKHTTGGSGPIDPDLKPGENSTTTLIVNQNVDMTNAEQGNDTLDIQVKRFGVLSNTIRIEFLSPVFDVTDTEILEAIKTGKYEGQNLLRDEKPKKENPKQPAPK